MDLVLGGAKRANLLGLSIPDSMESQMPKYRFRKCSDINREHPLFELLDGELVLLDVGLSDAGVLEVAFHDGIANHVIESSKLQVLLEEGRRLASDG
jgi:hypothetical protein